MSNHPRCAANLVPGHQCWGPLTGQHIPKRSQGGKRERTKLCAGSHDAIDNGLRFQGRRLQNHIDQHDRLVIRDRKTGEEWTDVDRQYTLS